MFHSVQNSHQKGSHESSFRRPIRLAWRGLGAWLIGVLVMGVGCVDAASHDVEKTPAAKVPPPPGMAGTGKAAGGKSAPTTPSKSQIRALPFDAVILRVDGVAVRRDALERALAQQARQIGVPPSGFNDAIKDALEASAYEQLVKRELLYAEAHRRFGDPKSELVKLGWDQFAKALPKGVTPEQALEKMHTTKERFDKDLKEQVLIADLMRQLTKEARVDDATAKKIYHDDKDRYQKIETASASQILIALSPDAAPDVVEKAKKHAEDLRQKVLGQSAKVFKEVSKAQSDAPDAKKTGGDLGTFGRRQHVPEFNAVVFNLKKGEIPPVFRTEKGLVVLRGQGVTRKQRSFDDAKKEIKAVEAPKRRLAALQALLKTLEAKAKIERVVPPMPMPRPPSPARATLAPGGHGPMPMHGPGMGMMPAGMGSVDHNALPLPSKDNVLPGMRNPHAAPSGGGLKLGGPKKPTNELQLHR